MKQFDNGASNLGKRTPTSCAVVALVVVTRGIWTKFSRAIRGKKHSLWRAGDQDGNVLDILVQSQRNKRTAKRFFRTLLKGFQDVPRVIITDKLRGYGAAKREILTGVEHRQHPRIEQPRGKFSPTHTTAREEHAQMHISPHKHNVFSLLIASHRWPFSPAKAPDERVGISCLFTGQISDLERG